MRSPNERGLFRRDLRTVNAIHASFHKEPVVSLWKTGGLSEVGRSFNGSFEGEEEGVEFDMVVVWLKLKSVSRAGNHFDIHTTYTTAYENS